MEPNYNLLEVAEKVILQTQYQGLEKAIPKPLETEAWDILPGNVTCLFRITEIVYNRTEDSYSKFTTILNSLHACGASCLLLIRCQNGKCELYLGAVNKLRYDNVFFLNTIRDVLRNGIEGNLPGTEIEEIIKRDEIESTLKQCVDNGFDSQCITAVSCVSGDREDSNVLPDGIERLFEAIGNKNFSIVLLADPVSNEKISDVRRGYEELGSQLSAIEQSAVAVQSGKSVTLSTNYSYSVSTSVGKNISLTQSHTEGSGWSKAANDGENKKRKMLSAGAGLLIGGASMGLGAPGAALTAGQTAISAIRSGTYTMSALMSLTNKSMENQSGHTDDSKGIQFGASINEQTGKQEGEGKSFADSEGITVTYSSKDYHIKSLIEHIDWYLNWLNRRENYGMFNCCTYIVSSSAGTNLMVASEYQALIQGKRDMNQPVTFNTWTQENGIASIRNALMHLSHPSFSIDPVSEKEDSAFTPAMLMSSKELSRQLALPQKSIIGIPVSDYASFGREVIRKAQKTTGKFIRLGNVQHMGKVNENQPILLDLQSMAAHTFIAGTNGSGKSNAVFKIVDELMKNKVPFLVVEPAKGEYKNVFGRMEGVSVYGTNETKAVLLRLNPFWFNDDVNVLEHIDKLIEVFNASWSMYAAMPAVLKAGIENAYKACGWDLENSTYNGAIKVFPTFEDVLGEFNKKMDSTAFSQEVKGNYVGALSTRMETMCNGIYGKIFGGSNLSDEELFDSNVIVDLSRVGSMETKAMIMGMLVIRLQEYRMMNEAMNLPLRHITILEEAHNLLKRTSTAQSDEGSNVLGKSVEMISSAIAEMRSFGEGFIIVDQSPGLLDMSVIRNTNTKIILRLPEAGDREMVGNTMGLTIEQIYEISRFGTGVSVVYQKDWREAVLCKVDHAYHEEALYTPADVFRKKTNAADIIRLILYKCGMKRGLSDREKNAALKSIENSRLSGQDKHRILSLLEKNSYTVLSDVSDIIVKLHGGRLPVPPSADVAVVIDWYAKMLSEADTPESNGAEYTQGIILAYLNEAAKKDANLIAAIQELPSLTQKEMDERIKTARGVAFKRITPLTYRCDSFDDNSFDDTINTLMNVGEEDKKLANLLRMHTMNHSVRQCREILPYSAIVWNIINGTVLWERTKRQIDEMNIEAWDKAARKWLRYYITTDRDTETAILSLYLQNKGKNPSVRVFYSKWFNVVSNPKKDVTVPIMNLSAKRNSLAV